MMENMEFKDVDRTGSIPIYKQLSTSIREKIADGTLAVGAQLPSINILSEELEISKDTVKKAYSLLRKDGLVDSSHGKGFFIAKPKDSSKINVLLLFDKLSPIKQVLFQTFTERVGNRCEFTIKFHNQDTDLLEHYMDETLDRYDYYLISPHFPIDEQTQHRVIKILNRVPNRKLILIDRNLPRLTGNYGSVYQDYNQDIYEALAKEIDRLRDFSMLTVFTVPESLYHTEINSAIKRFCKTYRIKARYIYQITQEDMRPGEVYLILNSQLDTGLKEIVLLARKNGLEIGKDIGIISYNESPLSEILLGGLSTVSSDFEQMGALAAEMVLSGELRKVKCDFKLYRRATF